mmetsp:Transcript_34539/g.68289  ORF Transcript_34539/g.68289 Transcript_34539/m.68289 type:complete len:378 (+) Transcript_34539:219-1352(+)
MHVHYSRVSKEGGGPRDSPQSFQPGPFPHRPLGHSHVMKAHEEAARLRGRIQVDLLYASSIELKLVAQRCKFSFAYLLMPPSHEHPMFPIDGVFTRELKVEVWAASEQRRTRGPKKRTAEKSAVLNPFGHWEFLDLRNDSVGSLGGGAHHPNHVCLHAVLLESENNLPRVDVDIRVLPDDLRNLPSAICLRHLREGHHPREKFRSRKHAQILGERHEPFTLLNKKLHVISVHDAKRNAGRKAFEEKIGCSFFRKNTHAAGGPAQPRLHDKHAGGAHVHIAVSHPAGNLRSVTVLGKEPLQQQSLLPVSLGYFLCGVSSGNSCIEGPYASGGTGREPGRGDGDGKPSLPKYRKGTSALQTRTTCGQQSSEISSARQCP